MNNVDVCKCIVSFISSKSFRIIPGSFEWCDEDEEGDAFDVVQYSINDSQLLLKLSIKNLPRDFVQKRTRSADQEVMSVMTFTRAMSIFGSHLNWIWIIFSRTTKLVTMRKRTSIKN